MIGNGNGSSNLYQEQEALWYLGGRRVIEALGDRMPGGFDLSEFVAPARAHVFTYRGTEEDEALYVTEGDATMTCGDLHVPVGAGMLLFLPCGVSHHLEVGPGGHFRYLTWTTPAGLAHEATRMGIPGQPLVLAAPSSPDEAKVQHLEAALRAAARRQGVEDR